MKKLLLIVFMVIGVLSAKADGTVTTLITDNGQSTSVENVSFLLAADDSEHFSVILKEGDPILNVTSVTFSETTGITETTINAADAGIIVANGSITLSGLAAGTAISIHDTAGTLLLSTATTDSADTRIDISHLPNGVLLLHAGTTSVKFIKK